MVFLATVFFLLTVFFFAAVFFNPGFFAVVFLATVFFVVAFFVPSCLRAVVPSVVFFSSTGSGRCHGTVTTPTIFAPASILIDRLNSVEPFQDALGPRCTSPSVSTAPSITPSQVMPSPDWIRLAATRPRLVILIRPHVCRSMTGIYVLTTTSSILIALRQPGQLVLMARIDTVNLYPHR